MGHASGHEDEEKNMHALFSIVEKTLEKAPRVNDASESYVNEGRK